MSIKIIHTLCSFSKLDINWQKPDEFLLRFGPKYSFSYLHTNTCLWKKSVVVFSSSTQTPFFPQIVKSFYEWNFPIYINL